MFQDQSLSSENGLFNRTVSCWLPPLSVLSSR